MTENSPFQAGVGQRPGFSKAAVRHGPKGGEFATVEVITAADRGNASYVGRVLHLTLLAPDIVEAILDGRQPAEITLAVLMPLFSAGWSEQRVLLS